MAKHKLHNHPRYEERFGLPPSEVIVDIEFRDKFSGIDYLGNMEFESHICTTKEQSKRLLSIGLKKETADMVWVKNLHDNGYTLAIAEDYSFIDIPAWSMGRLWEILPKELELYGEELGPKVFQKFLDPQSNIEYKASDSDVPIRYFWDGDIYDRLIDCFQWLAEAGYIDSEYIDVDKLFSL